MDIYILKIFNDNVEVIFEEKFTSLKNCLKRIRDVAKGKDDPGSKVFGAWMADIIVQIPNPMIEDRIIITFNLTSEEVEFIERLCSEFDYDVPETT